MQALDVGEMSHVVVRRDSSSSSLSPGWHLQRLEVEHLRTGQLLPFTANRSVVLSL
jgi:hypothetical protein